MSASTRDSADFPKPATDTTKTSNASFGEHLPPEDPIDFDEAKRGFVASLPEPLVIAHDDPTPGHVQGPAWSLAGYGFLAGNEPPPSINPSLWRMAKLNLNHGLFEVCARVYQVRGFDVSNMTIIEGNHGLIIIDPLASRETAKAGLELYRQVRGPRPVQAVIYTHSHTDHYGGVRGVIDEHEDVAIRGVEVIAPSGFIEAVASENIYAGVAMSRRALYQYGMFLHPGELGQVDNGLGKSYSRGAATLIAPTRTISTDCWRETIDGVALEYKLVSGTEAPSEMTIYLPQFAVLNSAEIACPLLHNILTLRGAQVRDAKKWAMMLDDLLARYVHDCDGQGYRVEVLLAQHNWPRWGRDRVIEQLEHQRDLYEFLHDQTLRRINHGEIGSEIAEDLQLPASLDQHWYTRGYYGTLSHNVKAIYQRYLGWYDGNPANLHALPPQAAATKFVAYMGGADAVTSQAKLDFAKGEYRWVAQVMSMVVFADPSNHAARQLEADALEQLGYQAESGIWRNWYLMGAFELRHGYPKNLGPGVANADAIEAMPAAMVFDSWGVRLMPDRAEGRRMLIHWQIDDKDERYALNLSNSALTYRSGWLAPNPDLAVRLDRSTLTSIAAGSTTFDVELAAGRVVLLAGTPSVFDELMGMLDTFDMSFGLVTP